MTPIQSRARRGVTLVELLVVMALIAGLAALALMIAPGIANQDNTLKGTADIQAALKISQGMAAAAKLPRGVRLLGPPTTSTTPSFVTELQYLECPPVMVPNQTPLAPGAPGPYVQFTYTATTKSGGAITTRQCLITGLNSDQASEVVTGSTLMLPTLGWFSRISSFNISTNEAILDVYPDAALGAGTSYRTYHFGIFGAPRPLLGEPTIELARNICVDLSLCSPPGAASTNYDIVFAPSGQRIATTNAPGTTTQVFLWVRDYTKVTDMRPTNLSASSINWQFTTSQFLQGGEQQIVGIRGAAIGTAPVLWPNMSGPNAGTYTNTPTSLPQDPYTFARDKLTGQ